MICEMCRPTNAISAWECTKKISIKQNKTKHASTCICHFLEHIHKTNKHSGNS